MKKRGLVLLWPLLIGGRILGLLAIGPELTGHRYGRDEFDLLEAICTQAASAVLAARMARELAENRQILAWKRFSAFVLHDIKNASAMLKLVTENACEHMDDPEFQQDMLEAVEDALKRMEKVRIRLKSMEVKPRPQIQEVELIGTIRELTSLLKKRFPGLETDIFARERAITANTDPAMLSTVLENLFLNSLEAAGGNRCKVQIHLNRDTGRYAGFATIVVTDNGPGIPKKLLPDGLFQPFATTRKAGTGVGLWQVRRLVEGLGGEVRAENPVGGGAAFIIRLPV